MALPHGSLSKVNNIQTAIFTICAILTRDVKTGFFGKPVLNRISVLITFIKNIFLHKANNFMYRSNAVVPNPFWLGATFSLLEGIRGHKDFFNLANTRYMKEHERTKTT